MPELADFQLAFSAAMGRSGGGALERQPGFAVYRNTTPNALIETLRAGYPVTAQLVGDEAFAILATDFARRRPPAHPVLLDYGSGFPHFLSAQPWIAEELPYLPDVSEIERLRAEAHVAADGAVLTLTDLARLGTEIWPSLRLPLHPAARFAWLRTPARSIWEAHQYDDQGEIAPEWRAEGALIARPLDAVADHGHRRPGTPFPRRPARRRDGRPGRRRRRQPLPRRRHYRPVLHPHPTGRLRKAARPRKDALMATMINIPSDRSADQRRGPLTLFAALAARFLPLDLLLLVQRLGIATIFFLSGRTKVEGWFTLSETTFFLFENDYALPFLQPVHAAYAATIAEHVFPVLLVLGLFTRFSALALVGMTLTIQIFVYPEAWPTHLSWAGLLLPLIAFGGGKASLDRAVRIP